MVRCRLILQVFPVFQQTYTMIIMPLSKENSHVSIKKVKHLRLVLIPWVKAMHPSLQHLQGRKRHPDDWAQFPSACNHVIAVQPRSFQKTFTAPTHGTEWPPNSLCRRNGCLKQGSSQPSSAWEWTLDLLSNISTALFPKFLHQPQKSICPTHCSPKEKAQHFKSCHRVQQPCWWRLHHQATLSITFQWHLWILNNSATFVCFFQFHFLERRLFLCVKTILSEISQTNTQHADCVFSWAHQDNIYPLLGRNQTGLRLMPAFNQTQLSRNSHSSAGNVTPIPQAAKHSGALHVITPPW